MTKMKPEQKELKKNVFAEMEEEVLEFWHGSKTFEKSVKKPAPRGDYVFYDGPPFITGMPHYATLLPSIAKDMIPRYQTMRGYRVERIWGWDCHGLPAENKVEEELELKNKQDIEDLGVDKFVGACRNYVNSGSKQWQWYIDRIARWVDMDKAYKTMDKEYMESVIWAFKKLYNQGLIYEGYRSSLHCPRCATPLSKFEITMDAGSYRDVNEESIVIKFKIKSKKFKDAYVLAWTTTPWTLPGNLALAVGENIRYKLIKIKKEKAVFILASDRVEEILKDKDFEVLGEVKGSDLVGLEYEALFDLQNKEISKNKNAYKIYGADFVSTEEGTGIVHIAPNFGEDDFALGKKNGLPMEDLMNEMGIYSDLAGPDFGGLYFKKAGKKVLATIGNKLFSSFDHSHSYPFCYRCSSPLIYKTQKAWYLRIGDIRKKMLENNKKINWVPEHFKEGRFEYNLQNAPDWCLSRSRYWGSPLPVWRCEKCEKIKVFGSCEEIAKASQETISDLHRPAIDKVEIACECGGKMKRVKEVLDCWFESGSMPFAQFHYPFAKEHKDDSEGGKPSFPFPADFIIEYTGQLRGWFYYLHVLSTALFDEVAFKNVIVSGVLAGTDGRKMSKSYGNYPDPKMTLHKYGADALRLYFMSSPIMIGGDTSLNEKDIQDALRKNIMILWNVCKFYRMFVDSPRLIEKKPDNYTKLDNWILCRLEEIKEIVDRGLESYDLPLASKHVTAFIDDFSTWYIRRSRDRFKGEDEADKSLAKKTTGYVLQELAKIVAPLIPFIAERIWQTVSGNDFENENESVHLEEWPQVDKKYSGEKAKKIIADMELLRNIVELGMAKRDEHKIKVRQPLAKLIIKKKGLKLDAEDRALIKADLNVKEIVCEMSGEELVVELDTEITAQLKTEGIKRELVRFINSLRKKAGLSIDDRVKIYFVASEEIKKVIVAYKEEIIKETLATSLEEGISDDCQNTKKVKIDNQDLSLGI